MSYQKCPVCDGRGTTEEYGVGTKCTVCDGKKIISTLNGRPPKFPEESRDKLKKFQQDLIGKQQDIPADIQEFINNNFKLLTDE